MGTDLCLAYAPLAAWNNLASVRDTSVQDYTNILQGNLTGCIDYDVTHNLQSIIKVINVYKNAAAP